MDAPAEISAQLCETTAGQLVGLIEWLNEQEFNALMPDDHV